MPEKKPVPFTSHAGAPLRLDVVGVDGAKYEILITLAVFGVVDTGEVQPAIPPNAGTIPKFEMQVQLAIQTRQTT